MRDRVVRCRRWDVFHRHVCRCRVRRSSAIAGLVERLFSARLKSSRRHRSELNGVYSPHQGNQLMASQALAAFEAIKGTPKGDRPISRAIKGDRPASDRTPDAAIKGDRDGRGTDPTQMDPTQMERGKGMRKDERGAGQFHARERRHARERGQAKFA